MAALGPKADGLVPAIVLAWNPAPCTPGRQVYAAAACGQTQITACKGDAPGTMPILRTTALQLSVRAASAAALAFWIAMLLGADHAIYALIGAVIVTDLSPRTSRKLAIQRLAGTLVGAAVGATLLNFIPHGPVALGVAILCAMLITFILRLEPSAARVAGYVAGIVMFTHSQDSWLYAFQRAWETIVGIGAALLVGLIPLWLRGKSPAE